MFQVIQVLGALAILGAYALAQFHLLDQHSPAFLLLNVVGAAILGVLAYMKSQWGFVLLEGVWTLVSAWSLFARSLRFRPRRREDVG